MGNFKRVALGCAVLLIDYGVAGAVTPNSPVTPQTPNRGVLQFLQTSTPNVYGTLYTAGSTGSKCTALWVDNNDTSTTHSITVQLVNAATKYGGIVATTVQGAGWNSNTPAQALMTSALWPGLPLDSDGNPYFFLINGDTIQATYATAITTGAQVDIHIVCADF